MREQIKRIIKLLISLLLMALLVSRVNYNEFRSVLGRTSIEGIFVVVIAYLVSVILNAIKWKVLLPTTELSFLIGLSFRAQLYSTVLPGQLFGEASKVTAWSDRHEDTAKVAASVVFDKITGMIGQLIIGVFGIYLSKNAVGISNKWTVIIILIVGIGAVVLSPNSHVSSGVRCTSSILGKINKKLEIKLLDTYESWVIFSSDGLIMFKSVLWGLINQLVCIFSVWYLSIHMGMRVDFMDFCWIIPLMSMILLLPISFAGIGLRDTSLASMLSLFSVSAGSSLVISLSMLLGQLVSAGIGELYILRSNIKK